MDKTTLYLPPELRRALAEYAKRMKRSQADVVREAIASHVGAVKPATPRFIGVGEDADLTGASSEEYLRGRFGER